MTTAIDLGTVDLNAASAKAGVDALNASLDSLDSQIGRTEQATAKAKAANDAWFQSLRSTAEAAPQAGAAAARQVTAQTAQAESSVARLRAGFTQFRQQVGQGLANNLVEQLLQHTQELTRDMDVLAQSSANVGIQAVAQLGPLGQLAAGALGVYGMVAKAEREQLENNRQLALLHDQQARLGPLYTNIASSIAATATAQERLNETVAAARGLLTQQAALLGQGFSTSEIAAFARTVDAALPRIRASQGALTENVQAHEVMAAVIGKNTGQLRQWGIAVELGENNTLNLARATVALNNRAIENAAAMVQQRRATLDAARAAEQRAREARGLSSDAQARAAADAAAMRATQQAARGLADAERALTQAVERQTGAVGQNAQALIDRETEMERLQRERQKRIDADEYRRAHAGAAHSAQEIRDLRQQIGLTIERTRAVVMHTRYIGLSISANRELVELEQRRARFEAQRHHTFAQRQRFLSDLQREIELRQGIVEQERAIRDALVDTEEQRDRYRTRLRQDNDRDATTLAIREARQARLRREEGEAIDALIAQERERQQAERSHRKDVEGQLTNAANLRATEAAQRANEARESSALNGQIARAAESLSAALGSSFAAIIDGSQSVKGAVFDALKSTMQALASESIGKALFQTASGLAALAMGSPTATTHFAAAGKFAATAVVAGGIAAGVGAISAPSSGTTASSTTGASSPSAGLPSGPRGGSDGAMAPITINYNAPVIGGRDAMAWETGARIGRYLGQADSRVRRAPALMGA